MTINDGFLGGLIDHARTYGSWRSQLMHVSVQKLTMTTLPRSSAGPSGSELSLGRAGERRHLHTFEQRHR
jgi:hypothetical protein